MSRKSILVVEDTRMIANAIFDLLSPHYDVVLCFDGKEGALVAEGRQFDLVLTDVVMPGMTGVELARKLRANPEKKALPIIALTSQSKEGIGPEADKVFDSYLVKPFGLNELPQLVKDLIGQ